MMMRKRMLYTYPNFLLSIMLIMVLIAPCSLSSNQVQPVPTPAPAADPSPRIKNTACKRYCGNIHIPRPFGITGQSHCYLNEFFAINCSFISSSYSVALLAKYNLELIKILTHDNEVIVKVPSVTTCGGNGTNSSSNHLRNTKTEAWWTSPNFTGSPFCLQRHNVFASFGCGGYAAMYNETRHLAASCSSACPLNNPPLAGLKVANKCYGFQCCQIDMSSIKQIGDFPFGCVQLKKYSIGVSVNKGSSSCRTAFVTTRQYFQVNAPFTPGVSNVPVSLAWKTEDDSFDDGIPYYVVIINIVYIAFPGIVGVGIWSVAFWSWWRHKTKRRRHEIKLRTKYFKERLEEQRCSDEEATEKIKLFDESELTRVTNNFGIDHILGIGGQGTVFKGILTNGQVIAVKMSKGFDKSQWKEFINEVILLSQIKHRHVVKLLGCCLEKKEPLVVYEYISNGTLSERISNPTRDFVLTWDMRRRIAYEVASALAYLHSDCPTPIYHRDVKSSNILLNDNYTAKLSDFGISKAVSMDQTHVTTRVQGTFGYCDPEYYRSKRYSEKSDVYSFGVVLVELLTGQKPLRSTTLLDEEDDPNRSLAIYFVSSMKASTLKDILDPAVLEGGREEDIMVFANLAYQCLNPRGLERPTMKEVARVLQGLNCQNLSHTSVTLSNSTINHHDIETLSNSTINHHDIERVGTSSPTSRALLRQTMSNDIDNFYSIDDEQRMLQTS